MRLPWWPIYVDARVDTQGVYYTIPGEQERLTPWHRMRFCVQNKFLICVPEDEHGAQVRHHRARVFFRISLTDHPEAARQAIKLQNTYLENPQNKYACKVICRNDEVWAQAYMLIMAIGLPAWGLFTLYQGYQSAPDNEPGVRYQNGLLMSMAALGLITLLIYWQIFRGLRRQHQSSRVVEVNQRGVMTSDSSFQWDDLDRIQPHFHHYMVRTKSGRYLLLPNNCCAIWILRNRIMHPPVLSRKLFVLCLIGSILSGPLFSAWFGYLAPEYDQPFGFWGISLILTSTIILLYGFVRLSIWQAKRHSSKTQ